MAGQTACLQLLMPGMETQPLIVAADMRLMKVVAFPRALF